ncbi:MULTISPECIES: DUF3310 domain-containing protein [Liquorilactobacillus]|uniref:DUF3310 domain-containing protein n=1 Tax=Liquorilactobacillus TaxID=2767888 RepID=UPI0039ED13F6
MSKLRPDYYKGKNGHDLVIYFKNGVKMEYHLAKLLDFDEVLKGITVDNYPERGNIYMIQLSDGSLEKINKNNVLKTETIEQNTIIKPDYYRGLDGKDLFDRFEAGMMSRDEVVGFYKGNIIKYVVRHEGKNGVEDLGKAKTYVERLTEFEKGNGE